MAEIIKEAEVFEKDGKKWMPVLISFDAVSMLNKIVLGDHIDEDDTKKKAVEKQVHEDCLELFKEFKN